MNAELLITALLVGSIIITSTISTAYLISQYLNRLKRIEFESNTSKDRETLIVDKLINRSKEIKSSDEVDLIK